MVLNEGERRIEGISEWKFKTDALIVQQALKI